ncbi:uncharacterized protein (TIGR02118 family) [Chryseobacterium sp. 52]|uniref:EthD family reductase n=1 Tax=Chryseobacterium sp. 52 TaxID=2035213 RepID=UPI000C4EA6F5|nr:EthD family reductase [Chryseobacterium sp. 52]PIF46128.1 uncharacterized protein (TIGR02118 family) [Chryseobacterium sp. 52]
MFKVTIFYPVKEGDWFDMEYYIQKHVPLSRSIFGGVLKGWAVEEADDQEGDGQNFPYRVIGHLFFEKVEDFYTRFLPNKETLEKDALHYTNVKAVIQISRVIVWNHYE